MKKVKAKKHLGQHFLTDEHIAKRIADSLTNHQTNVLEIGPGMGVLTKYLITQQDINLKVIEIDSESVTYLEENYEQLKGRIILGDFLKMDLHDISTETLSIIGNFPYNISSQIFFKVLDYKEQISEVVGMLQKEVAERLAAPPGSKKYGILSVFLQAYYNVEYLFTVPEHVFSPPPKVKSGVIRIIRNQTQKLDCDEKLFFRVVKTGFNQRRKTLSNSLKSIQFNREKIPDMDIFSKRPEQLGVQEFVELTQFIEANLQQN
ncbi:16S rRNA (adenine(1518)-N(6)/adenine(1519)-N(6))-dimethyltransferase RsmA [Saccharicrinis fermentans]|uniref:Ribosomal RNA small subunit methyltransferase A n=1 Tax=Saccharicrinis fermentans DSM 9555 = JCM 21142 TaxID=869213 RepID=W7XUM7_9BACT|nr:16S rRNA (adenine(1518)-N(6)/adenine(1519)-N(6))-dimethyltransferase RsmA [Saccharicrinis fermentans]GAF01725.1 ribosomal RNA small subunit methyltransferase A [Saccharicrinis fermentans DSM 9555 = JCM 21142]